MNTVPSYAELGTTPKAGDRCVVIAVNHPVFNEELGQVGLVDRVDGTAIYVRPVKTLEPRLSPRGILRPGPRFYHLRGSTQLAPEWALAMCGKTAQEETT